MIQGGGYMENGYVLLGQKIREYRKMHNMTQADLASILDVETDHIAAVERGRKGLSLKRIIAFCNHFNVPITKIIQIDIQNDTEIRVKWINEIHAALNKLDTEQIGMIKLMIQGLVTE